MDRAAPPIAPSTPERSGSPERSGAPGRPADGGRFALALALGALAILLAPGLALLGAPPHVPDESWRRPLAFVALALAAFLGPLARGVVPSRTAVVLALLALAPAVAAALHPNASAFEASSAPVFTALSATILLASTVEGARGAAKVVLGLGLAGVLAAAWILSDALAGRAAVGPFGRSGVAGPVLAALLVPAFVLGASARLPVPRALRLLPALLVAVALAVARSRTGVVAAAAGALAAAPLLAPPGRRKLVASLAVALVALCALLTALAASGTIGGGETVRVRLGLARAATALAREAPLLGRGPNGFARDVLRVRDPEEARISAGGRPLAAHDDLLHVAAENGVPAALAVAALLALSSLVAGRRARRASGEPRLSFVALFSVVVATAVAALAEDPLLAIAASLPFGLAAGLSSARGSAPGLPPRPRLASGLRYAGTIALAAIAFATAAVPLGGDRALAAWIRDHGAETVDPSTRDAANALLRRALHESRGDVHPALLYRAATGLATEERFDEAWTYLDRLLVVDPGATEARLDMAEIHRLRGRREDARDVLLRARELDPTRFDVPLRLGHLLLGEEAPPGVPAPPADPTAVLRHYDEAIALGPTRFEGPVALARFYRRMGDLDAARRELGRAKALGGLRGEVLLESFRLAEAERAAPADATAILALALAASPSLAGEVDREALRLLDAGDAEEKRALEAAAAARSGVDFGPADALFAAALLRRTAIVVAGLAPKSAWYVEARSGAAKGLHRRAVATWRALLADPFAAESPELAFSASKSAARFDAALSEALSARGRVLQGFEELRVDDRAAAERDFRAALGKVEGLAAAHYGLACVLARAGREAEAVTALSRAVELDRNALARAQDEPDLAVVRTRLPAPPPR